MHLFVKTVDICASFFQIGKLPLSYIRCSMGPHAACRLCMMAVKYILNTLLK